MSTNVYGIDQLKNEFRSRLEILDKCVVGIILFGSLARGEISGKSDIDLLVLHDGCGIPDPVERRRYLYEIIHSALKGRFEAITLLDMELKHFLQPNEITPLLLNIYWDGVVLLDRAGILTNYLKNIRRKIMASGLKRVKSGRTYIWILPKPLEEVRLL